LNAAELQIDEKEHRVSFDAKVARQNIYAELKGALEYLIVVPGGKEYEALFVAPVNLQAVYDALVKIGVKVGAPARDDGTTYTLPKGGRVRVFVEYADGKETRRVRAEALVHDAVANKAMAETDWVFTGSRKANDPETGDPILQAMLVKNMASLHHTDATVLLQNPSKEEQQEQRYKAGPNVPKEGTPVKIVLEAASAPPVAVPAGHKRIHLFIAGTVQGVGFREFTRRSARELKLKGWVRNLPSGEVELEAEGPEAAVVELEGKVHKGPRGAEVKKVESKSPGGEELNEFEILETPDK
jgi:acylphosphatase